MAAIYSTRFGAVTVGPGNSVIYTVPSGAVAVIRDISIHVTTSGGYAYLDSSETIQPTSYVIWTATNTYFHWTGRAVFPAGEHIRCVSSVAGTDFYVSGYLLAT